MNSQELSVLTKHIILTKNINQQEIKKIRGSESDLYGAICPLVYIIRIFGLAPYEFDDDDQLISSSSNMIFSIICLISYTCIIIKTLNEQIADDTVDRPLLGTSEPIKATFNFIVIMFDIIMTLLTRKKFIKIWNSIQDYDEAVMDLCYERKEIKTRVWVWSVIIINFVIWLMINQLGMYAFGESLSSNLAYMAIYVGSAVSITRFSGIVMMLSQRFNQLNEIAVKNMSVKSSWIYVGPVVDTTVIERLHNHLMIAGENLESIYSWSIMLWLMNLCLHIIVNLYFIISWIILRHGGTLIHCLLSWNAIFMWQLILLNAACDSISSEASCMGYIMLGWKRWLHVRGRSMRVDTLLHMMNRKLNFTAAGCFNVNLPLLRSIAGIMTTYLVILLQMS